ncbi:type III pantothenate kinase [Gallaecimonas pentaromativorans]|uniref:Type III pantothenate kinase n=1 Tax=Gallaecimonas pentaromativorans TaxID=584787 RepID=A0A3N1NWG2_9GAMM|nr:type III pantothenate kinase [Gallaecimonas pentaromativorans]ROQ18770.1 type III pantothenate kinase [Gallaecimonas pentaromativorans]
MTTFLVEAGNSFLKSAVLSGAELSPSIRFQAEQIAAMPVPADCQRMLFASVGNEAIAEALFSFAMSQGIECLEIKSEAKAFGVTSAYAEPQRLGVDRWLAMLAAFNEAKGACLVLDIGTAATADLIDNNGQHLGGWIAPGFQMMTDAVLSRTAKVIGLEPTEGELVFGASTGTGLYAGCRAMVTGFVTSAIATAKAQIGQDIPLFFTGGGIRHLPNSMGSLGRYRPDLVLEGLALYS